MKVKNPVSQIILIFQVQSKVQSKKEFLKEEFKFCKVCSFMHSILGRGSFSPNDSISDVVHQSDQPVALLRHH